MGSATQGTARSAARKLAQPMSVAARFILALLLVLGLAPTISMSAFAGEMDQGNIEAVEGSVYSQEDGFEPYQGWQDATWYQNGDPYYLNGAGGTDRKGYPAWSLVTPLSVGVTGYDGAMVTGTEVTVVTDTNKVVTHPVNTENEPNYYYNVVLPPVDTTTGDIPFTFNYTGAGGVSFGNGSTNSGFLDGNGGMIVATSPDPSTWKGVGEAGSSVVWEATQAKTTIQATSDNWWKNVTVAIDEGVLDAGETYYFGIKNRTAGYHGRLWADIVFEFSTDMLRSASWSGDLTAAGYGREQGNGGTKLGITDPVSSDIGIDLTTIDSCWDNTVQSPMPLDEEDSSVTFTVHADGSGSNWQYISSWTANSEILLYDSDPTAQGAYDVSALTPIGSTAQGNLICSLVDPERDWPSFDGVHVKAAGLEKGKSYYLVFTADFKPGNATSPLRKPIVVEFTTATDALETATLLTAIENAKAAIADVVSSADGEGVPEGTDWTSSARIASFRTAIAAAEAVSVLPDATQAELDDAVVVLEKAQKYFVENLNVVTSWEGYSYYQGFQGADTYVPDNNARAALETYGIWMDEPGDPTSWIDDVIVTDLDRYVPETVDLDALGGTETGADLWKAVNKTPAYHYNIITRPYDVAKDATNPGKTIDFMWERQGPGGNNAAFGGMGGYVKIYSELGADGLGKGTPVLECTPAQFSASQDYARHYSNWVTGFKWSIPVDENCPLEPNQTYYLVFERYSAMGNGGTFGRTLNADIVFEFSTDMLQEPVSYDSDTDIVSPYYAKQGSSAIVDLVAPDPQSITTNITKSRATETFLNSIATPIDSEEAAFSFVLSGANAQHFTEDLAKTVTYPHIHIYSEDGVDIGDSTVSLDSSRIVADWSDDPSITDMDFEFTGKIEPTNMTVRDGVLEAGRTYYLVFEGSVGVSGSSLLIKPVIFEFKTAEAPVTSWDISAAQDGSVTATVIRKPAPATGYTLQCSGVGKMQDFSSVADTPWYAQYGSVIEETVLDDGVKNIGAFALGLPNLKTIEAGDTLEDIGSHAFDGAASLVALDLSSRALVSCAADAFGDADTMLTNRTAYVFDNASATLLKTALPVVVAQKTAVAVMNGGGFSDDTVFASGSLALPEKEGHTFVTWTSDQALQHPEKVWGSIASGATFYAKFSKDAVVVDPVPYDKPQGFDQKVLLLDLNKLPGSVVKHEEVMFHGEDAVAYHNVITPVYDGNKDIVFAFSPTRGTNANGGDGAYQRSFMLPYISVLDDQGNEIATYNDGNGDLRLFSTVFDGVDGKSQGNVIYAMRVGLEANSLPAGTYTLRFSKDFGANNGKSFLGKNVDFEFTVERPAEYEFVWDTTGSTAKLVGFNSTVSNMLDVVIPDSVEGKPVTDIAGSVFNGAANVRSITVPGSVTAIGDGAFARMPAIEGVTILSKSATEPVFGSGVFASSHDLTLYGYSAAASVIGEAHANAHVTFVPIDDGVYVNGVMMADGATVNLTAEAPEAVVAIYENGQDVTKRYRGFISNTNVADHPGTAPYSWYGITGRANGSATLVIRTIAGADLMSVKLDGSGFGATASTDRTLVTGYQGNGSTIWLSGLGNVETLSYDETLPGISNFLVDDVPVEGALFTLSVGGPGSGWDISRWDWDDWTQNHLNDYIKLYDSSNTVVATIGNGLTWRTLTDKIQMTFTIDDGILTKGETYTLVAESDLTGHNVSARLLTDVSWTFDVGPTALALTAADAIPDQEYTGAALTPDVPLSLVIPSVQMWDTSANSVVTVAPEQTRPLVQGEDYTLAYSRNTNVGTATVVITGEGNFTGTRNATFTIKAPVVDKTALEAAIVVAQARIADNPVSADGKDIPNGTNYIGPEDRTLLSDAIAQAQAVAARGSLLQTDLDAATAALNGAIAAFDGALKTAQVDRSSLDTALDAARSAISRVVASPDGGGVAPGIDWATPAQIEALQSVIDTATTTSAKPDVTQRALDDALRAVGEAQALFEASINTANPVKTYLQADIAEASALASGMTLSIDGSDVPHGTAWTTATHKGALDTALANAQTVLADAGVTQNDIDAARDALGAAVAAFEASVEQSQVDTGVLDDLITAAHKDREATTVSVDGSDVMTTAFWVDQASDDALSTALVLAQAAASDPGRTKNSVAQAAADLGAAQVSFAAAKQAGSLPDPTALVKALDEARILLGSTSIDSDASHVDEGVAWVTQQTHDDFSTAIDAAQAVLDGNVPATQAEFDRAQTALGNETQAARAQIYAVQPVLDDEYAPATQADLDAAVVSLTNASDTFKAAIQMGTKKAPDPEAGTEGGSSAGSVQDPAGVGAGGNGGGQLAQSGDPLTAAPLAVGALIAMVGLVAAAGRLRKER